MDAPGRFLILMLGVLLFDSKKVDSTYISNGDTISLKLVSMQRKWMSCWGSGDKCTTRGCPGDNNPFETGNQYQYYFKCRGEVFWIHGNQRYAYRNIRVCDKVALRYSYWSDRNTGYWLSLDSSWLSGSYYNTRTCPGENFFRSNFGGRCGNEVFKLFVVGKNCGDLLEDRDVVMLRDKDGKYVGGNNGNSPLRPSENRRLSQWKIFYLA